MVAGRLGHAPLGGLGMIALEILKNHFRVLDVLRSPLRLRKDDPVQRALGALLQRGEQERLRVADEAHFAGRQAELLPNQAHQPVRIGAAGRIAVAAGGQDKADLLRRSRRGRNRARHLICEGLDH